ncbi:MAG: CRTAC1 family protein, partial [Microthrixaceae bacterium]|nr:CRTAC1 family protein [Microthrixaceae bacterium]
GDADGDGIDDLVVPRYGEPNALYRGEGDGRFIEATDESGLAEPVPEVAAGVTEQGSAAVAWADVDGDDDLDLFAGGLGARPDQLWINDGNGVFAEEAFERGVSTVEPPGPNDGVSSEFARATMGAAFADWDRDGDVDLITARWGSGYLNPAVSSDGEKPTTCQLTRGKIDIQNADDDRYAPSRLLANDGEGRFTDVTKESALDLAPIAAFTPVFADYDDDGWLDLFLTGDFCSSRLFRNTQRGGFVNVTLEVGVGSDENGMGSAVEDLDADGRLDWLVTSIGADEGGNGCANSLTYIGCSGNRLYRGAADGTFTDETDAYGLRRSGWGWGAIVEDLDNDGSRDVVAVNGYTDAGTYFQTAGPDEQAASAFFEQGATRLWQGGSLPMSDVGESAGLAVAGSAKSVLAADSDDDGDLDLITADSGGVVRVFRNDSEQQGHWLGVRLHDPTSPNTGALGARIRLEVPDGNQQWIAEARSGGGYQSSGPGTQHFGLGDVDRVAAVEVRWPDSESYERFPVSSIDQVLDIERNAS